MAGQDLNSLNEEQKQALFKVVKMQADKGEIKAYPMLAEYYAVGFGCEANMKEAATWWIKGAEKGEASCQYNLGLIYLNSSTGEADNKRAFELIESSSKQNFPEALFTMGGFYLTGTHVDQDLSKGADYYLQSAKLGFAEAQYMVGCLYVKAEGVKRNIEEAVKWFNEAAKQGHQKAISAIDSYNKDKTCFDKIEIFDDSECANAIIQMADNGDPQMQFRAGLIYEGGHGVKADFKKALNYYLMAAENGYMEANYNIAIMYCRSRIDMKEDIPNAVKYFTIASDNGIETASLALAIIYMTGYKTNEDITKGSKLLKKISKTNKTAKELLDLYDTCDDSVEVKKEFTKYLNTIVRGKNSDEISYDSKINFKKEEEFNSIKEVASGLNKFDITEFTSMYEELEKLKCEFENKADSCDSFSKEETEAFLNELYNLGKTIFSLTGSYCSSIFYCLSNMEESENFKDVAPEILSDEYNCFKELIDYLYNHIHGSEYHLNQMLSKEPYQYKMLDVYLAVMYEELDEEKSERFYDRACDNDLPLAHYFYALKCYKKGEYNKVIEHLSKITNDYPTLAAPLTAKLLRYGHGVEKNFTEAYNTCVDAANFGNLECLILLGDFYMEGIEIPKDVTKALSYYKLAIDYGYTKALDRIVKYYYDIHEYNMADTLLRKYNLSTNDENVDLILKLAPYNDYNYATGGFSRSEVARRSSKKHSLLASLSLNSLGYIDEIDMLFDYTSEEYALKAIGEGDLKANYVLGELAYKKGEIDNAISFYQIAANSGSPDAKYRLSKMIQEGTNIQKDEKKALELLKQAAEGNNKDALYEMGYKYLNGEGVRKNKTKAIDYLLKAANMNHGDALYQVGELVTNGEIKHSDESSLYKIYYKAFVYGSKDACKYLATYYEDKDEQLHKCFNVYERANSSDALYLLGYYILNGENLEKNEKEGVLVLEKASEMGNLKADYMLSTYIYDKTGDAEFFIPREKQIKYLKAVITRSAELPLDEEQKVKAITNFTQKLSEIQK
ncbi:MAG: sel1 repeat family protein [Bacilli bacterium]|nr:sel1 repeat family protein [Bacilli bacterium]